MKTDLNLNTLVVTLNEYELNAPVKRQRQAMKKAKSNYMLFIRDISKTDTGRK